MACKLSLFTSTLFPFSTEIPSDFSKIPAVFPLPVSLPSHNLHIPTPTKSRRTTGIAHYLISLIHSIFLCVLLFFDLGFFASGVAAAETDAEVEIAEGYTITQFVDKIIDVFLHEKPKSKDWRKYLIFRDEWKQYREKFYNRCKVRADAESDSQMKQKLIELSRKVRKVNLMVFAL